MKVTRNNRTGEITVVLSQREADDLTYEIAVSDTTDSDVVWDKHGREPHNFPLHKLHGAILSAKGVKVHKCTS